MTSLHKKTNDFLVQCAFFGASFSIGKHTLLIGKALMSFCLQLVQSVLFCYRDALVRKDWFYSECWFLKEVFTSKLGMCYCWDYPGTAPFAESLAGWFM